MTETAPEPRPLDAGRDGGPRADGDDARAERARTEPMAVLPAGEGWYDVVTEDRDAYAVDLLAGTCTCPDHRIRGARCKHLRRVALEVTAGLVPPPGYRAADCANCGAEHVVADGVPDPVYCATCTLSPGEFVLDDAAGDLVAVVRTTDRRADETPIPGTGYTVASYPGNGDYPDRDVVVEVVYPPPADLDDRELAARHLRRYSFPRSRLRRPPTRRSPGRT